MRQPFKLAVLCAILIVSLGSGLSAQTRGEAGTDPNPEKKKKIYTIKAMLEMGMLIGGDYKTGLDKSLTPTPNSYQATCFGIEADIAWFYIAGDFLGVYRAQLSGYDSLAIFNLNLIRAGVQGKIRLFNIPGMGSFNIHGRAGLCYSFFDLESEYKSLFPSYVVFYKGPAHGIGFGGGGGMEIENGFLVFGFGVYVDYMIPKYAQATQTLNIMTLRLPFYFGITF